MSAIRACEILSSAEQLAEAGRWTQRDYSKYGSYCLHGMLSKVGVENGDLDEVGFTARYDTLLGPWDPQYATRAPYGRARDYVERAIRALFAASSEYRWESIRRTRKDAAGYTGIPEHKLAWNIIDFNDHLETTIEDIREVLRIARMTCYAEAIFNLK